MPAVAAIGGAVLGGAISSSGAKSAAKTQAKATDRATEAQREMFDITRADQQPYRDLASQVGIPGLRQILGQNQSLTPQQVMAEPGYQFGLQQGLGAIDRSAAARGGLYSGQTLKALTRYGTDYGSTKYNDAWNRMETGVNNRFNRFATAAGIGQAATNQVSAAGQQFGQQMGNNLIGAGNANAAATIGSSNAWSNALNRVTSYGNQAGWFGGGGGGTTYAAPTASFGAYNSDAGSFGNQFGF